MRNKKSCAAIGAVLVGLCATTHADIYQANAAVKGNDAEKAFALYLEIAELGQPQAQEIVAQMYVNGEGVPRDNLLGYAWATIAKESGRGANVQPIIDQLEPHLTDSSRARVHEIQSEFGRAALEEKLMPIPRPSPPTPEDLRENCAKMVRPVNIYDWYPPQLLRRGVSGTALVAAAIGPDHAARNPLVLYSYPLEAFDLSTRAVAINNGYRNESPDHRYCTMRYRVKYSATPGRSDIDIASIATKAESGEPSAQLAYGLYCLAHSECVSESRKDWFLGPAQAGLPLAQYLLGVEILTGTGAARDPAKGARWIALSAKAGNSSAMVALANYLLGARGDASARRDAFHLLERASDASNWLAKFYLAALLVGDSKDDWYDVARASKLMADLGSGFDYDPAAFEIRAAIHAASGDFKAAKRDEQHAISMARQLGWELNRESERMAGYDAGHLWNGNLIEFGLPTS